MKAIDMRPGMGFKMDGKMCVVVGTEHRTPGNLRAFVQLTYREILAGKTLDKRMQPSEDIEILDLDRREMEYLYSDSQGATFMDTESYEQYQLGEQLLLQGIDGLGIAPHGIRAHLRPPRACPAAAPGSGTPSTIS